MGKRPVLNHMFLKNVTAVALILMVSLGAEAAFRCDNIFTQAQITREQIHGAIRSIAELNMQVDIALSRGELTAPEKILKTQGKEKFKLLVKQVDGMIPPDQIRRAISKEIQRLQILANEQLTAEGKIRAQERQDVQIHLPLIFQSEKIVEIDTAGVISAINYLPAQDKVILRRWDSDSLVDLKTGAVIVPTTKEILQSVRFTGPNEALIVDNKGDVLKVNMQSGNNIKIAHLRMEPYVDHVSFSPLGKFFAVDSKYSLNIYSSQTGKRVRHFEDPAKPGFLERFTKHRIQSGHQFIDDRYIMATLATGKVYLFDIQTEKYSQIESKGVHLSHPQIVPGTDTLAFYSDKTLYWIAVSDVANFSRNAKTHTFPEPINSFTYSQDGKVLFVDWGDQRSNKLLLDAKTLEPLDDYFLITEVKSPLLGPPQFDNDNFVFVSGVLGAMKSRVQIWKKR